MSKLTEDFKKLNRMISKKSALTVLKEQFELENKNNEVLKSYIKLLKDIEKQDKAIESVKPVMYEEMLSEDIDDLQGDFCTVTLVRPFTKTNINRDKFLDDFKPGSKMYEKYIEVKDNKGHIKIKVLEDK